MPRAAAWRAGYRFGSWELGVRASGPGGHDSLDALRYPPGAQDIDVIGQIREQAGLRRVRPARAACHTQAQGTAPSIRPAGDRSAETVPVPAATENRLASFYWIDHSPVCATDSDNWLSARNTLRNGDKRAFKHRLHSARYVPFWPSCRRIRLLVGSRRRFERNAFLSFCAF